MNEILLELLSGMFEDNRDLFAIDIQAPSDLHNKYNVFHLFGRGSVVRIDLHITSQWDFKVKARRVPLTPPIPCFNPKSNL
jgi:hypothetical protein